MNEEITQCVIAAIFSVFLRWTVSLNPYSGAGNPPMYGDYEAQRHWMEIAYNLPVKDWYTNSSDNDLLYWGLDYPPLTAYHSWLCGYISHLINPDWVALRTSRGYESYDHKLFMRYTVLVADLLIYIPAMFAFVYLTVSAGGRSKRPLIAVLMLSYPGLILVDHGHFQYNGVSLGLTLWAIVFIIARYEVIGSAAFVLALNYKQMELYHAFPFFFYLLGLCFKQKTWMGCLVKLASIGVTVVVVFIISWLPFLHSIPLGLQVLNRIFPVARGLYEDKVANFWCSLSILIKIKQLLSQQYILIMCLSSTLLACVPSSINLLAYPTKRKFILSLINCSLAFFLFSFQVHEKSIIIAALPVCLLLSWKPLECTWFLLISVFSMYPLLDRDGQTTPYIALMFLFYLVASQVFDFSKYRKIVKTVFWLSIIATVCLHVAAVMITSPDRLPDLFPVLFSIHSCGHFLLFLLYFNYLQFNSPNVETWFEVDKINTSKAKKGN